MPALPRRERLIVAAGLAGIALAAWAYLIHEARRMNLSGVGQCMRMNMAGPDSSSWPLTTLLSLFLMWAIMMLAMMLPSALPMMLTFATASRNRQRSGRAYVSVSVFAAGYVTVWSVFSALAAIAQWWLHQRGLLSDIMVSTSPWLGGCLLLLAGVFQFTRLKDACLAHCRGPLGFIMTRWRDGHAGAFRMGIEHGAFCVGCCWALMALLFVAGVMNVLWIVALTIVVCLEKILPRRTLVSVATGIALTFWGLSLLVAATGIRF